ncbi:MAG: lipopolysaccharide heptosyltransferase I [Phycisphaerae bacterium]
MSQSPTTAEVDRSPSARQIPVRILLIKPSSLGDIVHGLPVLAALRRTYPNAHISWLVNRNFADFLEGHPLVNELIVFDRKRYGKIWYHPTALASFVAFLHKLRTRKFDLVIDLQGLFRSGFLTGMTFAKRRVGFADAREASRWFYSERTAIDANGHAVERNVALARSLGMMVDPIVFPLAISGADRAAAERKLLEHGVASGDFVAVVPGARWPSKQWPIAKLTEVSQWLRAQGMPIVLLGAPDERAAAEEICTAVGAGAHNLAGATSLRELSAILERASSVVCMDSGPMHIAAALQLPTISIFGPTNPARTGPYSDAATVVRRDALPCMPCYRRICPLGHHNCMNELESAAVTSALQRILPPQPDACARNDYSATAQSE